MGAVTMSAPVVNEDIGKSQVLAGPLVFSGTYATSGDTLDPETLGDARIKKINHVEIQDSLLNSYLWDRANGLILGYVKATGAEVANAVDLTGEIVEATIWLGA